MSLDADEASLSALRLGAIEAQLPSGAVGPIRINGHEMIRRIFVTVRDATWTEVAPIAWDVMEEGPGAVLISARHRSDDVDFAWSGRLELASAGDGLTFEFSGIAGQDMQVCRLGLVVLLPSELAARAEVRTAGPDGDGHVATTGGLVPQEIVGGLPTGMTPPFTRLSVEAADGRCLDLSFEGDLFELEDQRNWGDASFKAYCTPLSLGFPRPVLRGETRRHATTAVWSLPPGTASDGAARQAQFAADSVPRRVPAIGVSADLAPSVSWAHWAYDLDGDAESWARAAAEIPRSPKIDLGVTAAALDEPRLGRLLAALGGRIARIRLSGDGPQLPEETDVVRLRRRLVEAHCAHVPILAATRGYFVEFNRGAPFNLPADGVAFPISPSVHGDDLVTTYENAGAVAEMIGAAQQLTGCSSVSIAPLALKYPAQSQGLTEIAGRLAWAVAALIGAARAGAESITLGADLVAAIYAFPQNGAPILDLVELAGRPFRPLSTPDPDLHLGLAEQADGTTWLFAVNLGRGRCRVRMPAGVVLALGEFLDLDSGQVVVATARIEVTAGAAS